MGKCEKYKDLIMEHYKNGLSTNKIREILPEKIAASTIMLFIKKEKVSVNNYKPTGCFKKGSKPWNKGIKSGIPKSAFKKGQIPKNKKEITWDVNENGCWICTSHKPGKQGYPRCTMGRKQKRLNRIMYEKYYGEISDDLLVCHKCDVRMCIRPDHLFVGTQLDNMRDMDNKGRRVCIPCKGEKHGMVRLTEQQIIEIRSIENITQREIAKKYGLSETHVSEIIRRKVWKHI